MQRILDHTKASLCIDLEVCLNVFLYEYKKSWGNLSGEWEEIFAMTHAELSVQLQ